MSFLQVKRKWTTDIPEDVLLIASKKKKIESITDTAIFEFRGTADQKEGITHVISNIIDRHQYKQGKGVSNLDKLTERFRVEQLERSKNNRLTLVNYMRKKDPLSEVKEPVTVINLDKGKDEDPDYVYDLYYSQVKIDTNDPEFSENYYIHEMDRWYPEQSMSSDDANADDEDDSNDENNWRNDYPDEEESDDSDGSDIEKKMKKLNFESYSSSDEDEDDYCDGRKHRDKSFDYYNEVARDTSSSSSN